MSAHTRNLGQIIHAAEQVLPNTQLHLATNLEWRGQKTVERMRQKMAVLVEMHAGEHIPGLQANACDVGVSSMCCLSVLAQPG